MERLILRVAIFTMAVALVCPAPLMAQDRANAVSIKGGVYQPVDDLEDGDAGANAAVSYNRYFSPFFALEFSLGYFETEVPFEVFISGSSSPVMGDLTAIPVTVNAKGILPFGWGELYGGAGLGVYFVDLEAKLQTSPDDPSDSDTVFGAQLLAGILFNLTQSLYLGIEGQLIATGDAKVTGVVSGSPETLEGNLNGYTVSGVLGFRF